MDKTVIFVPHYKGSFRSLLQLALHVQNNKVASAHFVLYFGDNTGAKQVLKEHGIKFSTYKNRSPVKIPVIGQPIKLIADLISSVRLVNRLSPVQAMVCAVESHEFEYALISVLNKRNINTIVLQWAQTVPKEYYQSIGKKGKRKNVISVISTVKDCLRNHIKRLVEKIFRVKFAQFYGDGDAKYFAVMGKYYKEMFCKQGVSEDKLIVTGHPEHDRLFELLRSVKNPGFRQTTLGSFGLDNTKPVWILAREAIVYFKLVCQEKDKQDICAVLKILSQYDPQAQIILKLHPRDAEEYYDFVRRKFPHVILIKECDLYSLISVCNLYISQISNTMMWAIALDKPVISYDFNNQPYWHYFRDKEGIIKVDSPEELAKQIKTFKEKGLSAQNSQKYQIAKQKYMTLDGKASERIAELIMKGKKQLYRQ